MTTFSTFTRALSLLFCSDCSTTKPDMSSLTALLSLLPVPEYSAQHVHASLWVFKMVVAAYQMVYCG